MVKRKYKWGMGGGLGFNSSSWEAKTRSIRTACVHKTVDAAIYTATLLCRPVPVFFMESLAALKMLVSSMAKTGRKGVCVLF